MGKLNKNKKFEYMILILAISLIVVLFLVFSASKPFNKKDIIKSPQIKQELNSEKQTIEGTLEVIHADDFENKKAEYFYYLKTDGGIRYSINYEDKKQFITFPSGSKIRLRVIINLNEKTIENPENIQNLEPPRQQQTIGEQRIAVILANFQNDPNNRPVTREFTYNAFFNNPDSVNAYYQEVSYDKLHFAGNVYGWYTLPIDPVNCDFYSIINASVHEADPFIFFPDYDIVSIHVVGSSCIPVGSATLGRLENYPTGDGPVDVAFNALKIHPEDPDHPINGPGSIHEIGHNLGTGHANGWLCPINTDVVYGTFGSTLCDSREYLDYYDVMGDPYNMAHMNAVRKEFFGWLTPNQTKEVVSNGVYVIEPIETNSSGIKSLIVPNQPIIGNNPQWYYFIPDHFYLEYRQPIGFDDINLINEFAENSILFRINLRHEEIITQLVDFTPYSSEAFADAPLKIGNSYEDPLTGTIVRPISATQDGIRIEVIVGLSRNPSFEVDTGIDFFTDWGPDDSYIQNNKPDGYVTSGSGILDNIIKYQGTRSLKIQVTNNRGYSYQDIPVEYNKKYRVSGYVKTDCNDNNCYGTIISECENINHQPIWDYNNCKLNINPINIRRLYGDNNWTYIEFDVENNRQDAKFLRVLCYNTPGPLPVGSGIVWCDSLNVIEIPRGTGSPLFLKAEPEVFGDR